MWTEAYIVQARLTIHTHIHTLVAKVAVQGATCSSHKHLHTRVQSLAQGHLEEGSIHPPSTVKRPPESQLPIAQCLQHWSGGGFFASRCNQTRYIGSFLLETKQSSEGLFYDKKMKALGLDLAVKLFEMSHSSRDVLVYTDHKPLASKSYLIHMMCFFPLNDFCI